MRNKIISIALLFFVLVLGGCSNQEAGNKEQVTNEIGNLELEIGGGKEIVQEGGNDDLEEIDELGRKTYRNEEYGFEIKYLEDWVMNRKESKEEKKGELFFRMIGNLDNWSKNPNINYSIVENKERLDGDKWVNKNDFFKLIELKEREEAGEDLYWAYGVSNPDILNLSEDFEIVKYSGGVSGGGIFELAMISFEDEILIISYNFSQGYIKDGKYEEEQKKNKKRFIELLRDFKFQ